MTKQTQNIRIELVDTNSYRNHIDGKSQIVLSDDRIIHEAISNCEHYMDDLITPSPREYYIREVYKKEGISGVCLSSAYHDKIKMELYNVTVCIIGSADDIIVRFNDRKKALNVYKEIAKWVFDDK